MYAHTNSVEYITSNLAALLSILICTISGLVFTFYSAFDDGKDHYMPATKHSGQNGTAEARNNYVPRMYTPLTMIKSVLNHES